jgi:hypothetical protein
MKTRITSYFAGLALISAFALPGYLTAQPGPPPSDAGSVNNTPPPSDAGQVPADPQQAPVTLQTFYDQLAPYGQWVNWPQYGGYVFIPSVAPGFMPYSTSGHWVYSDAYGWTWASDYAWGWAAFHYGRWNYDPSYGWFWIPDLNWGPAWVTWRSCEGYYGWAPLPWGINVSVGFGGDYGIAPEHWCFVPQEHICELNLFSWFAPRVHYRDFIAHSTVIGRIDYDHGRHFGYFKGPDRVEVEHYINHPVVVTNVNVYRGPYRPGSDVHHDVVVHDDHRDIVHNDDHHDVQRHDDHPVQSNAGSHFAPQRAVEINNVPQRSGAGNYHNDNRGRH